MLRTSVLTRLYIVWETVQKWASLSLQPSERLSQIEDYLSQEVKREHPPLCVV